MKCRSCGLPDIKPTAKLPCVLLVRLSRQNIAQLLTEAERRGITPEWIVRGLVWNYLGNGA